MQLPATAKEIEGFPGYWVTPEGEVWSTMKRKTPCHGPMKLSPRKHGCGYLQVYIQKDKGHVGKLVHRLVALVFIPNPDGLPCVLHYDGDPKNNTVTNLRWGTKKDNAEDQRRLGEMLLGEKLSYSKLKNKDIPVIRKSFKRNVPISVIAKKYNVSGGTISLIVHNKIWRHIS